MLQDERFAKGPETGWPALLVNRDREHCRAGRS